MTWGKLKALVEWHRFFDDDTEVMIRNEKGLFCETEDDLAVDFKDRIVLAVKDYSKDYNENEDVEDTFWSAHMDALGKAITTKAKERYERLRKSINTNGISKD